LLQEIGLSGFKLERLAHQRFRAIVNLVQHILNLGQQSVFKHKFTPVDCTYDSGANSKKHISQAREG
jgi:hypothetical protein